MEYDSSIYKVGHFLVVKNLKKSSQGEPILHGKICFFWSLNLWYVCDQKSLEHGEDRGGFSSENQLFL